jgi:hypothetical protein
MNSIIANNTEAAGFADGSKKGFIVPVKGEHNRIEWNPIVVGKHGGYCNEHGYSVKMPYQIGKPVYVREAWWSGYELDEKECVDENKPMVIYRADTNDTRPFDVSDAWCINEYGNDKRDWLHWRSPATMPRTAARTWITPTSVKCVRVRDLTQDDVNRLGINAGNWNDTRGKFWLQFTKKHGQSAWDTNIYVFFYQSEKQI